MPQAKRRQSHIEGADRWEQDLMARAMAGKIQFVATDISTPDDDVSTFRFVMVELQDLEGNVHSWYNHEVLGWTAVDTSITGTASLESVTAVFENGRARIQLNRDAADFIAGETTFVVSPTVWQICGFSISQNVTGTETFVAA